MVDYTKRCSELIPEKATIKENPCGNSDCQREKTMRIMKGEVFEDKVEWLNRSLIGETLKPVDFDILEEKLFKELFYLINVRVRLDKLLKKVLFFLNFF